MSEDKRRRQYIHHNRAFYAKTVPCRTGRVDEVVFGIYADGIGTTGEMCMSWHDLGPPDQAVPRLDAYCDAWHLLVEFSDVVEELVSQATPTPLEFCAMLDKLGFEDATPVKNPNPPKPRRSCEACGQEVPG